MTSGPDEGRRAAGIQCAESLINPCFSCFNVAMSKTLFEKIIAREIPGGDCL